MAIFSIYTCLNQSSDEVGSPVVLSSPSALVANIWPFLNRDADSVSQWIQPAGWVSLKNENLSNIVDYHGFFNDLKIFPQNEYSFAGFFVTSNGNHYAYSNPLNVCPATGSRINTLVCSNQTMVPAGQDFPCNLLRTSTTLEDNHSISSQVIVYPNPTSGSFTINAFEEGYYSLSIMGSDGKAVLYHSALNSSVGQSINIARLPAGIYYLQIQTPNSIHHEKIVKQ